jgi:tripartite-type tricarboxylate transporter receptor subunit TctC
LERSISAIGILLVLMSSAVAQTFPNRPIKFVSPYPPGGAVDILARVLGQQLHERLGQPVVVENRAGGSGILGTAAVAKSPPDGYTLLMASSGPMVVNPNLFSKLPYDIVRDFAPVTLVAIVPSILGVHPSVPVHSVKELISLARLHPGKLNFASSGNGGSGHLAGEMFNQMAGVKMTHVPYRGTGNAVIGLLTGEVSVVFENTLSVLPHLKQGRIRGLAVTSSKRSAAVPHLPTVAESALRDYSAGPWFAVLAPVATPQDIIGVLNREFVNILRTPDVSKKLAADGADVVASTPEYLAERIQSELKVWGKVIKQANIKLD